MSEGDKVSISTEDAAGRLGVPEHEVIEVRRAPGKDGDLVTTLDGVVYHIGEQQVAFYANYPSATTYPVYSPAPGSRAEQRAEDATREEVEAADPDEEPPPDGAPGQVLAWVNRDQARAARALAAERKRDKPRAALVDQLQKLASP